MKGLTRDMENKLQLFENEEFGRLEILMIDGKPYFPATECAEMLGYSKPHNAVSRHCRYSLKRGVPHPQNIQKVIEINYIPEGDLYRLIIRSKLPAAERFEKWVFDEVLPEVRKYGAYITDETLEKILESPFFTTRFFREIAEERQKTAEMEMRVAELTPKARYYDTILQSANTVPVSLIAKDYGMAAAAFNKLLHGLKIQYKLGGTWLLYQQYAGQGYVRTRTYYVNEYTTSVQTYWTQKGRFFLYDFLKQFDIVPLMEACNAAACQRR